MNPDKAKRGARRWFIYAAVWALLDVLAYVYWRPVWDVFHVWVIAGEVFCIAEWSSLRGFIRGWNAGRE